VVAKYFFPPPGIWTVPTRLGRQGKLVDEEDFVANRWFAGGAVGDRAGEGKVRPEDYEKAKAALDQTLDRALKRQQG
jgi:hypothetical protein